MLSKNYYFTLGVSREQSADTIRHAFREQVKRYHPERIGTARAQVFDKLIKAYHMLSNAERRREYDRSLSPAGISAAGELPTIPKGGESAGLPQVSPALRARAIFIASLFDAALAQVSRNLIQARANGGKSAEGIDVQVVLSAAEALKGGIVQLAVPSCSPCQRCGGTGREGLFPCDLCDGEGLRQETENLRVRVPENVGDGTHIKVPLRGLGPHNFYLCVCIRVAG
jgi:molecular chaperone DnaJ